MSDLISRSRAIENIWDVFNSYANDNQRFDEYETEAIDNAFIVLQKVIENQPTAYDVDAVVKELEESTVCGMFGAMFGKSDTEIIDIIRKGGVKRDFLLGSYNR